MNSRVVGWIVLVILLIASAAFFFSQSQNRQTNTLPSPTPKIVTETPEASPTGAKETQIVNIYFIALEDNGVAGKKIGCNDSVVPVKREIAKTQTPLKAVLEELLSYKNQYFGESGLYNALYQSDLRFDSAVIQNGEAVIKLSGILQLGGACDNPRVKAQIEETALQFQTVSTVRVLINNKPIDDVLSGRNRSHF